MPTENYIHRIINIDETLKKKSVLLLGPRRTGKSSLIKNEIQPKRVYNLLDSVTFRQLALRPSLIREQLEPGENLIVIDEIQKLPNLMDEVHLMIEDYGSKFLLTGSSARKLRRTHTSLMAGRAKRQVLHPFCARELGDRFDLQKITQFGCLPPVYLSDDPWSELESYVGDYLREEIMAEALSRNIESFSRFLQTAAYSNGELLNFEAIASDAQVPARTIREYYSVLEDTLIGSMVDPITIKKSRKSVSKSKFYFFDLGVLNSLLSRKTVSPKTPEYGNLFETWVYLELKAYLDYRKNGEKIHFWRTHSGEEVDFIVDDDIAIEVKATSLVNERHLSGLLALNSETRLSKKIVVSQDTNVRRISEVEILPYTFFIDRLWNGEII